MSGICGFIDISKKFNKEDMLNAITAMNSALYASNDGYIYQDDDCIIGKSDNYADNDSFIVFFYGELYNKQSLCKIYDFTANNEAQLVLAGYEKFGDDFFKQLSGKFVFVIYDKKTKKLTVIRDKVGSKQMYYYKNEDCFVFCTELAGLLATNIVPKKIDKVSLSQFLQLTYIPAPQCIIENVKKVKPAVVFCLDSYANIFENDYWTLTHSIDEKYTDFEVCKAELNDLLYASVKEKMALYPDSGAFLSGGFDSSIVVSVMSDISDTPIRTFTIGYDEKQFDESELAGLVAKKNNTNHTVLNLDWDAVVDNIDTVLNGVDEPYGDSSLIATYAVCKLAKEHTDVAFMGDAGDELFAGYNKYLISYYGGKYKKIPKFLRKGIIEPISKLLPRKSSLYRKVNKVISSADMPIFEQRKRLMSLGFKAEELKKLMLDGYVDSMNFIKENYEFLENSDEQTRAQYVDFKTVLEGDMLPKVELASRLSGLKTCAPILDDKIIDFAYSIPTDFKINKTNRKIILKETFRHLLPEELFTAPKHGFAVPIGNWLETNLKDKLLKFASKDFLEKQGLFNYDYINMIIDEHFNHKKNRYSELWAFFVFQNWYKKYIEQ
ncbi:MAG: asparagine synthase (glutamine-hydrolyzing) [Clostridia bacterium]|nr:asparagine synthase (glutamine-hydrolyzing) [Clostridia bacterium]